jgi:single-strand DNA-binding protein
MFDTQLVIVGNALTAPEWRRTTNSNHLVANFRVASTARRMDRETGRWVDGNSMRVRVVCWRRLAEGVATSISVGDPVIVQGRLYTRDWTDPEGNPRTSYEMEATAVGLDLARGKARFFRSRPTPPTATESDGQVRGEPAELVPEDEIPMGYGDGIPDVPPPTLPERPERHLQIAASAVPATTAADDAEDEIAALERAVAEVPEEPDEGGEEEVNVSRRTRRSAKRQPVAA